MISWYVLCIVSLSVFVFFFFNDTATTEIYTLSLHDALPICRCVTLWRGPPERVPQVPFGAVRAGGRIGVFSAVRSWGDDDGCAVRCGLVGDPGGGRDPDHVVRLRRRAVAIIDNSRDRD